MNRRIAIGIGTSLSLTSAAAINLTHAYVPVLLTILGIGLGIFCWEVAPLIADRLRGNRAEKEKNVLPFLVMALGVLVFAGGAVWYSVQSPSVSNSIGVNFPAGGAGGKAGSVAGATAIGGKGGPAGDLGPGGPGGDASASGAGSFALGGEGGEGGRSDRAARGGRGPFDVLNHPDRDMIVPGTNMRLGDFGRGGDSAPPPKLEGK